MYVSAIPGSCVDVWPCLAVELQVFYDLTLASEKVELFPISEISSFDCFFSLSQPVDKVLMAVREEPLLEFHCKQMDHFVGLQFSQNFHFALMVHLVKGMGLHE